MYPIVIEKSARRIKLQIPIGVQFVLQIESWRTEDNTFRHCPVTCTLYKVDSGSNVLVQLSALEEDLRRAKLPIDEERFMENIEHWFARANPLTGDTIYRAAVISPGKFFSIRVATAFSDLRCSKLYVSSSCSTVRSDLVTFYQISTLSLDSDQPDLVTVHESM